MTDYKRAPDASKDEEEEDKDQPQFLDQVIEDLRFEAYDYETASNAIFFEFICIFFPSVSSRWSKLKGDWRLSKSLQALVCNVLPSYWDIGSDGVCGCF